MVLTSCAPFRAHMSAALCRAVASGARRVARLAPPVASPRAAPRLLAATTTSGVVAASFAPRSHAVAAMAAPSSGEQFSLPDLPYPKDALEPHTSARTLEFHHGKHHAAYVANLNKALQAEGGKGYAGKSLDEVVKSSFKDEKGDGPVFNNAGQARICLQRDCAVRADANPSRLAQHWNHSFFWQCMKPGGGGAPPAALEDALKSSFGSVDAFKAQFKDAAVAQFGSGWAWLVHDADDKLKIIKTPNAENPLCYGQAALLTCDVWEHAYCAHSICLSRCLVRADALRCRPGLPEPAR